jgi:hypothetical protein
MFKDIITRAGQRPRSQGTNEAQTALLRWLALDDADQQEHYVRLREWYDGDHDVPLTDRQKQYLGLDADFPFCVNYLPLPVELCVERLTVKSFDAPEGIGGDDGLLMQWWRANRMDGLQNQVHRAAVRDGDTYVLIEWDNDANLPRFYHEPAFDGTEGVKVHYTSSQRRSMTFASKRWTELTLDEATGEVTRTRRMNIYRPDRIERYIESGAGWRPYEAGGVQAVEPWPAGVIPIVHFRWRDDGGNWGQSELEKLVPLQMSLNKAILDESEARDRTAFQIIWVSGARATAPDGTALTITPGTIFTIPSGESTGVIPPASLGDLRQAIADHIVRMAQLSHIPLQYFQVTGAVASADTQRADDSQIVAKVASESVAIGNAWEDVMRIALALNGVYGSGGGPVEEVATVWEDFNRVDKVAIEAQRASVVAQLVSAGATIDGAAMVVGYTEEEIVQLVNGTDLLTPIAR